ncbi:PRC-barrel domain-containing protein [Nisaea sediminum]|uniref:PRC-barrel domain-containing protein n=1 Tax=Nisaea sediminum TaxID=2775867 RepID=UPI0018664C72|nr:PRC-barrel domain-containing protein [Nisaea sediminum]
MIRNLLATTALSAAVVLSGAASSGAATGKVVFGNETKAGSAASANSYHKVERDQILASVLIGQAVYNSAASDAEPIGDINDIVMTTDGIVVATVIGVGGVLGIGEKDVAVDIDRLVWIPLEDGRRLTVNASKAELEAAPEYDREKFEKLTGLSISAPDMKDVDKAFSDFKTGTKKALGAYMPDDKDLMPVDLATVQPKELVGAQVFGADKEDIGEISRVLLAGGNRVEAYVVDVGGFLGIGEKRVALGSGTGRVMMDRTDGDIVVQMPFTQAQLEAHPAFSAEAYDNDPEIVILR